MAITKSGKIIAAPMAKYSQLSLKTAIWQNLPKIWQICQKVSKLQQNLTHLPTLGIQQSELKKHNE